MNKHYIMNITTCLILILFNHSLSRAQDPLNKIPSTDLFHAIKVINQLIESGNQFFYDMKFGQSVFHHRSLKNNSYLNKRKMRKKIENSTSVHFIENKNNLLR